MSVLIDPYMFELSDEQEIKQNIPFFQTVNKLLSSSNPNHRISIAIYKGVIDKLQRRVIQPFPIQLNMIHDRDLKDTIMVLNNQFSKALLRSIESIDIDECVGEQEFYVEDDASLLDDRIYYEMLCTLLIPCYSETTSIDNRIMTGEKRKGKKAGDSFDLTCCCDIKNYTKHCIFVDIDEFIPTEEKAITKIKEVLHTLDIDLSKEVPASMGSHHNFITADGRSFSKLNDLSSRSKMVLSQLREIGLFKIIFGRYYALTALKPVGTMDILEVKQYEIHDIVKVRFYAETERQIDTDLYFPKEIGIQLQNYFQSKRLDYLSVGQLLERIR